MGEKELKHFILISRHPNLFSVITEQSNRNNDMNLNDIFNQKGLQMVEFLISLSILSLAIASILENLCAEGA